MNILQIHLNTTHGNAVYENKLEVVARKHRQTP